MKKFAIGVAVGTLFAGAAMAETIHFSIRNSSDILVPGPAPSPPTTVLAGSALGLPGDQYLNALSFGGDDVPGLGFPSPGAPLPELYFSVAANSIRPDEFTDQGYTILPSVGVPGTAVFSEDENSEAHGDVFVSTFGSGTNTLYVDEETIPLTTGFFGDDLDALDITASAIPQPMPYFSISKLDGGPETNANDIFFGSVGSVFASGELHIGLDPFDNIDALALFDGGTIGVLDPGVDMAVFSLAFALGGAGTESGEIFPSDLFFTDFTGGHTIFLGRASLGLEVWDELNALDIRVQEPTAPIPLPSGLVLMLGALGLSRIALSRRS